MRPTRLAAALALPLCFAAGLAAAPTTISGAAILDHAIGKLAVKNMGMVHAGKVDEAMTTMGSKSMQAEWKALSKEDRKMMGEMMKEFAVEPATFTANIKKFGKLTIDGSQATLTVVEETKDASGSSRSTMTQRYELEGNEWKVTKE
jgi:hypothetical protein